MLTKDDKINVCNKMHPCIHDDNFPTAGDLKSIIKTSKSFAKSKNSYLHNYKVYQYFEIFCVQAWLFVIVLGRRTAGPSTRVEKITKDRLL